MESERTEQQSTAAYQRSKELSLKRTQPPTTVPGYELKEFLGSGAYGEVWVGVDQNTGRRVAVKFYTHRGGLDWSLLSREVEKLVFLSADRYVVQLLDVVDLRRFDDKTYKAQLETRVSDALYIWADVPVYLN